VNRLKTVIRVVAPILVLALGAAVMAGLVKTKPKAEEKPTEDAGVVVRTMTVEVDRTELTVSAQGTVLASREVELQPEVAGRVIYRSKNLVPGGRFTKGEVLLRLDPGEYSLRAAQSAAQVEQARQQLAIEESRGELAEEEWQIIGEDERASDVGRAAALRKPQRAEA
jgi:multidrug resistance efflux pump